MLFALVYLNTSAVILDFGAAAVLNGFVLVGIRLAERALKKQGSTFIQSHPYSSVLCDNNC